MFVVLDTEVYWNYFLATFIFQDGRIIEFERFNNRDNGDLGAIGRLLLEENCTLVTFNGINYDLPILSMAMMGCRNAVLKEASDKIIKYRAQPWDLERKYKFTRLQIDHIDIINLLPLFESLKLYAARINCEHLQDLPYEEHETIDVHKQAELRSYCRKDCYNTWSLFLDRWEEIQLRVTLGEQYDLDLRSKSDAQIAEAVIKSEYEKITGSKLVKPIDQGDLPTYVNYDPPVFLHFKSSEINSYMFAMSHEAFELGKDGKAINPTWLKNKAVTIDNRKYAIGLGGLHAKNKTESYRSDDEYQIIDLDVRSYYPATILNNGYEPPHMGAIFTRIFSQIVQQRIEAKIAGDKTTADVLKITINGTYGKLGSRFSAIYAPQLLLAVTFTGQLSLLMLIEMMAQKGIQCVSANTDGITLKVARKQLCDLGVTVQKWEELTNYKMEATNYQSIHYRDVNNYFALTNEGEIKRKGIFKKPGVSKNPTAPIITEAAIRHILYNDWIEEYIMACPDVTQFLSVRTVKGGAAKDGEYLGKAVRWYYSTETDTPICYVSNGNKVAKSDCSMPMMDLTEGIPFDLDYKRYIDEAIETVELVGENFTECL